MLLPNFYMAINMFGQELQIYNATQVNVDFEPVQVLTPQTILATVQKADPERLQIDNLDLSLLYIEVHAPPESELKINDQCFYNGDQYKLIFRYPDQDYGFLRVIFEQIKHPPNCPTSEVLYTDRDGNNYVDPVGDPYIDRIEIPDGEK